MQVKTKHTTKQLELVHSDVCGTLSTPTCAGHRFNILFIDDYSRYIFVWALSGKKLKTCTSAYHPDMIQIAR